MNYPRFNNCQSFNHLNTNVYQYLNNRYHYSTKVMPALILPQMWYLIKNHILCEVDILKSTQLEQLQYFLGGHIESVNVLGKTEAYVDEEGGPFCKNLAYNTLANEIFGISVYGPLIIKATKPINRRIIEYKSIVAYIDSSSSEDEYPDEESEEENPLLDALGTRLL